MNVKRTAVIFIASFILLQGAVVAAAAQVNPETLAPQFREWLKLTTYIITPKEGEVFLQLQNDREREIFIEAFWRQRDPTPGTPANEYREEHIKRFAEANRRYRFGSAREGWMTDRGKLHIILGPPQSIESIAGSNDIYPTELWSYYGDTSKGLLTHFVLVFYRRGNAGEYKLYDPFQDGPSRLLINAATEYNITDYETMYERIYELQPDLAVVTLSIVPGNIPFGFQPSMETQTQMAAIYESPKRAINDSYATHFLNYKGLVSTEYLTNEMECATDATILFDPISGTAFCHFSMAPKNLSLDFYEPKNEYFCNFQVDVGLRSGAKVILQYAKDFPLSIPADRLADAEGMGISIQDAFPIIEGKTKLTVLFRNTVGKEFAVLEKDLDVPEPGRGVRLVGPLVGYKQADGRPDTFIPYQAGDRRLLMDPKMIFSAADEIRAFAQIIGLTDGLWKSGSVRIDVSGSRPQSPAKKQWTAALKDQPFRPVTNLEASFSAADLTPDYYDITVTLVDERGQTVDVKTGHFILTAQTSIAHPIAFSKTMPRTTEFLYIYTVARQYEQVGQIERAESLYAKAQALNPSYLAKIPEYASFLIGRDKAENALSLIEAIKADPQMQFSYLHIKGQAFLKMGRLKEALEALEAGNRIYNSDTTLLNDLGRCYLRLNRVPDALTVFGASLKLNPDQADIKAIAAEASKK